MRAKVFAMFLLLAFVGLSTNSTTISTIYGGSFNGSPLTNSFNAAIKLFVSF